ncbi:MAG: cation:proton antiporter subunit C [Tissierellia bacterium]|jgi:multicomponent Na+:H+ antiporter subunit C|nr:cation:proton antiporter subunit C [Tissierellia bacterium]
MIFALFVNYYETISVILFGVGFAIMLLHRNLIRKIIGMNIMDVSIFMYLATKGYITGREVPIVEGNIHLGVEHYINPLPGGLVLTGIVVSVCMTAFALSLVKLYYEKYGTLDLDEDLF